MNRKGKKELVKRKSTLNILHIFDLFFEIFLIRILLDLNAFLIF